LIGIVAVFLTACGPGLERRVEPAAEPGTVLWTFAEPGMYATPAVGADGRLYLGVDPAGLVVLGPDGGKERVVSAIAPGAGGAALGPAGTAHIASFAEGVAAVGAEGKLWDRHIGESLDSGPALGPDGSIYAGSTGGRLHALSPDGETQWVYQARGDWIAVPPAVGSEGTIYFGDGVDGGGYIYALTPEGQARWVHEVGDSVFSPPALGGDSTVYVGSDDGRIYALSPEGERQWAFATDGKVEAGPVIGPDGTVYAGSRDGYLYALTREGELRWAFQAASAITVTARKVEAEFASPLKWAQVRATPAVADNGTVYLVTRHGLVLALTGDGDTKWTLKVDGSFTGPGGLRLGPDGTLYLATNGRVTAIATGSSGPADSPWPQFRGNARGTGRSP